MPQAYYNDAAAELPAINTVTAEQPPSEGAEAEYAFDGFTIVFNEKIALIPASLNRSHG